MPELQNDYRAMRDMYFAEPADFDDIVAILASLERKVNGA